MWIERKRERFRRLVRWSRLTMGYNIIIVVRCTAVVRIITNDGKSSNAHTGDGPSVTAAVWARQRPRGGTETEPVKNTLSFL